ncbi:MAG: DUF1343 domain-containing protein [Bacteroidota bacterium]|nr:DUF1343 domain-containing protein [Candidatus Kapabacteria bacterium]MCX7936232.1 DUF1343 domain-containing protein [Chlorobiota bacterium]MDW8271037.1 DUF1343 domain-containing protein [Bacteroidota bacterium]
MSLSKLKWSFILVFFFKYSYLPLAAQYGTFSPEDHNLSTFKDTISHWIPRSASFVKFGIDNLIELHFEPLRGKRVAVVCHTASRTRHQKETIRVLLESKEIIVVKAIIVSYDSLVSFGRGNTLDHGIPCTIVHSPSTLSSADFVGSEAVIVDLLDIGIHPSPSIGYLLTILNACAEISIPVYILDRPNPFDGLTIDGPIADMNPEIPIPYLHGMTIGELALMLNEEGLLSHNSLRSTALRCSLFVVKMRRWRRSMTWEDIGIPWSTPYLRIPTLSALRGMALLERIEKLDIVSVGIGTNFPYQLIGAPDFDEQLIKHLRQFLYLYGISSDRIEFVPEIGTFAGRLCRGLKLSFPSDLAMNYHSVGNLILIELVKFYAPLKTHLSKKKYHCSLLKGNQTMLVFPPEKYLLQIARENENFLKRRHRYLLYP